MPPIRAICFAPKFGFLLATLAGFATLSSCGGHERVPTTLFAGPGQLALAGTSTQRVFLANRGTDSVQVLALQPSLDATDFVRSAARYFPLHLPVGTEPTELASAGSGGYVFVLDAIDNSVSVIDAENLRVVGDPNSARLQVGLGDPQAQARGMTGHVPATCTATHALDKGSCVARAYVTQKALGIVSVVDVRQADDGSRSLVVDDVIVVGGSPEAVTMGPSHALFVTDDAAPAIIRVRLANERSQAPVVERFATDAVAGSIAVTRTAVAVTRPSLGDVLVLGVAGDGNADVESGTLSMRDGNPTLAPIPRCLASCSAPSTVCASAHPADRALCINEAGYASSASAPAYVGLPTQGVPHAIAALRADALSSPFVVHCAEGSESQQFSSGFAVASFNGAVEFIGIDDYGAPHMIDAAFCSGPQLADLPHVAAPAASLLQPCPSFPADRRRFACAKTDNDAGVLVLRGQSKERIGLQWEGVLPHGEGEALIDATGRVHRASRDGLDFAAVALLQAQGEQGNARGDVMEVVTRPRTDIAACAEALRETTATSAGAAGSDSLCMLERRIAHVWAAPEGSKEPTALELDSPLPAACFPTGFRYRLRAGDSFVVGRLNAVDQWMDSGLSRVAPGGRYGQPTPGTLPLPVAFGLRADLPLGETHACHRYLSDGRSTDRAAPWRSRAMISGFQITDPARTLQMSASGDSGGRSVARLGFLPHHLLFVPSTAPGGVRLLVSFAGSNALYVTPAQTSRDVTGETASRRGRLYTN